MRAVEVGQANVLKELKGPSQERSSQHCPPLPLDTQWLLVCLWFELTRNKQQVRGGWVNCRERGYTAWAGRQDRLHSEAHR